MGLDRGLDDAQHAALLAAGAQRLFAEKVSGAQMDRSALARLIRSRELRKEAAPMRP